LRRNTGHQRMDSCGARHTEGAAFNDVDVLMRPP
jgi:hypothetical protein